ncbi:MAG: chromosomal replication initiator protein DnaA [Bifidobacteriaceae bacterium]|nr:chromosomal replication initiator protein DnaA [Bifidobacteriaceae bacterium]
MTDGVDIQQLWRRALDALGSDPSLTAQQRSYLRLLVPVTIVDGTLLLAVGSHLAKDYIESHSREALTHAINTFLDVPVPGGLVYAITVDPSKQPSPPDLEQVPADPPPEAPPSPAQTERRFPLNPKYTFETFVVGESNRYPHAAAVAVAETPGGAYNPLFIYGGSGLGKTHLLHAIGIYAQDLDPAIRVLYCTSEDFTSDFINSLAEGQARAFQRRYRDVDILLIDDIQFLQDKEATVTEFFHTFNHLHNSNKQIVITSDVPPKELGGFEERLVSRFQGGFSIDIHSPDLETRIAILRTKAAAEGVDASDDTIDYIASHITANIRELEGALIRVTAYANLNHSPVDRRVAEIALRDFITVEETPVTASTIIAQTASYFTITLDDLTGPSRSREIVNARQIAMFLCRELTDLSLPKIAQQFNRDHTTVLYADQKIRKLMAEKHTTYNQINELSTRIRRHTI